MPHPSASVMEPPVQEKPRAGASVPVAGRKRYLQEKVMLLICLVFFGGVVAMTVIPEPFNGAVSGLVLFLALVVMYRTN